MDWEVIKESLSVLYFSPVGDDLGLILWAIFLAAAAVLVDLALRRGPMGRAIRALREKGCSDEKSALTARALGLKKEPLFPDRLIERVTVEGEETRFYLPTENEKKARGLEKAAGTRPWHALLCLAALYLTLVLLYHLLPEIFSDLGIF